MVVAIVGNGGHSGQRWEMVARSPLLGHSLDCGRPATLAQRPDHDREAQQRAREPFGECKEIALDGLLIAHV